MKLLLIEESHEEPFRMELDHRHSNSSHTDEDNLILRYKGRIE